MNAVIGALAGLLFGTGLIVSGMTDPANILAFLDFTGDAWSPALALVMASALLVATPAFALAHRLSRAPGGATFQFATKTRIDARLLGGATLFGIGWGLSGFCPGPAIVVAGGGSLAALAFVAAMAAGMLAARAIAQRARDAGDATAPDPAAGH